ncbi:MAG: hypothetical protein AB7S74_17295 [Hyphomicrobium sp.]
MAYPTVEIIGKKVILLSGYQRCTQVAFEKIKRDTVVIKEIGKLQQSASKNPDAVAFGYMAGRWIPAA